MYDLMAARFALDKLNDANQCNTNRIWLISEGAGSYLALAWIAAEAQRNSTYVKGNRFDDAPPPEIPVTTTTCWSIGACPSSPEGVSRAAGRAAERSAAGAGAGFVRVPGVSASLVPRE